MRRTLFAIFAATLLLAGCTSGDPAPTNTRTMTNTITNTRPPVKGSAVPLTYVKPLGPGARVPSGERERNCPYIAAGLDTQPTSAPNIADIEGSRVGRHTVLFKHAPVGCRFYFSYSDYHAIADILPYTYASPAAARSAMIATAQAGKSVRGYQNFTKGVDGISFQTRYYRQDAGTNNAFAFAKGKVMVIVRIDQNDSSANALYLARAIVTKI